MMSTCKMRQAIAEYFKTQPVLKAWLFGSFARGSHPCNVLVCFSIVVVRLSKNKASVTF